MDFGVLCNGNTFQQWQIETIRNLVSAGHTCSLLIVNSNPAFKTGFRKKAIHYPYSKLFYRVWFRYMMHPEAKKDVDITSYYAGIPEIHCKTVKKGFAEYFDATDVKKVKDSGLDFILRFGFGIIKGDILEAAKYGIWSYHHDDELKYRGVPTGFWEIMFGDPVNAAILQRLTSKLDSGIILHKAYFGTINHSWQVNLDNLLKSSNEWPLQVCNGIENGNLEFLSVSNPPSSKIYKLPGNLTMLRFLLKLAANKLRFHYHDLFLTEKWNVGIVPMSVDKFLQAGDSDIPEPVWLETGAAKSLYHADPFGFVKEDMLHIICEEYDYKSARGILTAFKLDRGSFRIAEKTKAHEKDYHLAYPFLFEHESSFYCLPENSAGGNLELFRYNPVEGKLEFEITLIPDLQAVDPTLFFHEGFWWLFFTDKISTNERLNIWYSENLHGPYLPHANNPVKVDIRSSRPAGNLFIMDGKLMRPAQDCSIRSGRRICINQVLKLSPIDFQETNYAVLNSAPHSKFGDGMHTFCVVDQAVIVDGKREQFVWQAFRRKLMKKINRFQNSTK